MIELKIDDRSCPRFRAFLDAFNFEFPGIRQTYRIIGGTVVIHTVFSVSERNSHKPIEIQTVDYIYDAERGNSGAWLTSIRSQIRDIVLHEIDEQIRYQGRIVFDPHKNYETT